MGGGWKGGVFSVRSLDSEDLEDLNERFNLPRTFQTKLWITTDDVYQGQTEVYRMTSIFLKEWRGDLALLNNGDHLRVQRIGGQIGLREDSLNPERLVFYQDLSWTPLPVADE